jgi:hypothetical protein
MNKLQEIIDLARSEDVPLFFEFTKRSLGKAVGKSIKVAVVGIQNADGAHQPFKKLQSIAVEMLTRRFTFIGAHALTTLDHIDWLAPFGGNQGSSASPFGNPAPSPSPFGNSSSSYGGSSFGGGNQKIM